MSSGTWQMNLLWPVRHPSRIAFANFWRRNRVALAATLLVATSLGIGFLPSFWRMHNGDQHRIAYRDIAFKRTMHAAVRWRQGTLADF